VSLREAKLKEKLTYADYLLLPDDGYIYQIIDGELHMAPAPSPYHQRISRNIEFLLWSFVSKNGLGEILDSPCDVVLSPQDIVQPDLLFISRDRSHIIGERYIEGPPDLIVEILSPSTVELDRKHKKELYQRYGVKEYWIVDPNRKEVEVYTLEGGRYSLHGRFGANESLNSPLLGLTVSLREVF